MPKPPKHHAKKVARRGQFGDSTGAIAKMPNKIKANPVAAERATGIWERRVERAEPRLQVYAAPIITNPWIVADAP